ncbi:MAG: DUF2344 domain-containing protein [Anaerolineales bacterium]|nr:DUF2344 domain-containing protein [Anaerolineales bacterium]
MNTTTVFRYRIQYGKGVDVRFIGHLDLQRTWERIFRRAAIPLAFTQGFHPHPRLNLGLALALGWTSECELLDVWLTEEIPPELLQERLDAVLPPALPVLNLTLLPLSAPKLQKQIRAVTYRVTLPAEEDTTAPLRERIDQLLAAESVQRERRGKAYDLRPLMLSLEYDRKDQPAALLVTLTAGPSATGRPDEVLLALSIDPLAAEIHRTALILNE